ncbi:GTPase IMAP family member 4 (Immunity-associated nucleotide 1 protein) (IAN-1) (hIAN1) (Immunity-associated protein 4), partial [Durusdinium trenchii]
MGIACCSMKEQLELLGAESAAALSGTLSAMSVGSQEPRLPPGGRFTVMMFGMTGSGKSALGNLLAGYDHFVSGDDTASVTNNQSVLKYEAPDRSLVLLDTIGLGDTELDQDKVVANIRDSALSAPNGVDAMVFVMRSGRITDDVIARLIYATEYLWGTECLLNLYIVVTYASRYVTQREEAAAWIERQCELNWRFRHIYSLVGNNENRILFVDNPDPADGEPLTRLRRHNSRQNILKAFVNHPRDIIPPFTHAMMKKAQEKMDATLKEVKKAEEAITELEAKAAEASRKDMEAMEKEMAEAKERKRKAEEAYKQEMKNIQEDEEFRRMAAQAVEEATVAFGKKYEHADSKVESMSAATTSVPE